jgi:hypothetical protein
MGLGWDFVLKLAAFGFLLAIVLQVMFYFVFQNIGYDSLKVSIGLSIFIFAIIGLNWVVRRKKYLL